MKLLLTIEYDGGAYCGWQAQKNGRSVQEMMTRAVSETYGCECKVTGCSRTDAGVHAKHYVCTAEADTKDIVSMIPTASVPHAINARLPEDISVVSASTADDEFHPRYSVRSKTYEYVFYDGGVRSPFYRGRAYHVTPISPRSLEMMNEAAHAIEGKHDFRSFMASGSKIEDTVRNVYDCHVERRGECVVLSVTADGFLYNMVRIIAGTVYGAAVGRIRKDDIENVIDARDRSRAGTTLPAEGLYLTDVIY